MRIAALLALLLPAGATGAQEPSPARPPELSWTGVLDEAEFKKLHQLKDDSLVVLHGQDIAIGDVKAYLSLPPDQEPPLPAVLLVHEWWGLNRNVKHWADRLAADGYAALAIDLYGGVVATTPDAANAAMKSVEEAAALQTLRAGHAFLATDERIRAEKRACIGWCFGGAWALRLAIAAEDLDAAVIYYGRLVTDEAKLQAIRARVLGVFGTRDRSIPEAAIDAFAAAMRKAQRSCAILRYDAEHAFANPSNPRYDEKAAGAAWTQVRRFLAQTLRGEREGPAVPAAGKPPERDK